MKVFNYLPLIEADLKKRIENLPDEAPGLYEPITYFMSLGGKRIRPVLALTAHSIFNPDIQKSLPLASALELFHNFSLVHDDIMDNAPLRRGKPTVHEKWNISTGILAGDAMLVLVYEWLNEIQPYNPELIHMFNQGALKVCQGQQLDMEFQSKDLVTLDEYMEMTAMKTGWLLGTCLSLGALNGGAGKEEAVLLRDYGIIQGKAFQVMDDLLDVYGGENFGKKTGGDIEEGKMTWLLTRAIEIDKNTVQGLLSNQNNGEKIEQVMEFYREHKIREQAEVLIDTLNTEAIEILKELGGNENAKMALSELFTALVSRSL